MHVPKGSAVMRALVAAGLVYLNAIMNDGMKGSATWEFAEHSTEFGNCGDQGCCMDSCRYVPMWETTTPRSCLSWTEPSPSAPVDVGLVHSGDEAEPVVSARLRGGQDPLGPIMSGLGGLAARTVAKWLGHPASVRLSGVR